jgi:BirA family biotin operon repressor/biotin-[acetyl-CoA-carboxylase] ligase
LRFELIQHDVIDSTSERAFAAIAQGSARHGDVHIARAQTKGRGRFGRSWFSPPGEGLYASVVLLPAPPPWNPAALTMAAGLALYDAARELGVAGCTLKWPNDLMIDGAKLAGVLVETRGLDPGAPHYVVGIGLNVRQETFPEALASERAVTSLSRLGLSPSIERASQAVLAAFSTRIEEVERHARRIVDDFLAASRLAERPILVRVGSTEQRGRLVDISFERGLCLRAGGDETHVPLEFVREIVQE